MICLVSGGFDPIHIGHVRFLEAAAKLGCLMVALNSDAWLMRKKGFVFMPWEERAEILRGLSSVLYVVPVEDADGTVVQAIVRQRPGVFANGGDRTEANAFEHAACLRVGAEEVFGVGGGKVQSSSALLKRTAHQVNHIEFDGDPR